MSRLKSLRQRVWPKEQSAIGEAFRDLHVFCENLTVCAVAPIVNAVWAEPFSFALERRPQLVTLNDARVAGTLTAVDTGPIDWQIATSVQNGTYRVVVNKAATLKPGSSYDLKFLVVY